MEPLYASARHALALEGRPAGAPWTIVQRIEIPDPGQANAVILADLEGGAGGLELVFAGSATARPHAIAATDADSLGALLDGVYLDIVSLRVDSGESTAAVAASIEAVAAARGVGAGALDLALAFDPLGFLAASGAIATAPAEHVRHAGRIGAARLANRGRGTVLEADGRHWHDAGATEAQELAAVLATATAYWRGLEAEGIAPEAAIRLVGVTLAADQDQFRTIAKFRALRKLWTRLQQAAGIDPAPVRLHAQTSWRSMSRVGPHVNLLRSTIAGFAAGIGGADSVTVLPFTSANGLPDGFARRLARNTQSILLEESNLARVADPAAGSGLVEAETDGLAARAWSLFQEIEAEGGMAAALASGRWQERVASAAADRAKAVARRKQPLTGASEFPDIAEQAVPILEEAPAPAAPAVATPAAIVRPLPPRRLSEPFEALRAASDRTLAETGRRPRIFLANLGRIADFNTRSTWARNLFEAGGIEAVTNDGFASLDELVAAFRAAGTPGACLCSSDAVYGQAAAEAAAALRAAGAGPLLLAGRPADAAAEAAYAASGIDGFVQAGMDVLAALGTLQERLAAAAPATKS
ncbi:methylmalonyl-CoA mutase family protein [Prosthecomicrobium sp. N25]|uniref:methylmalonyl-CoA mutase family protein n=1 Tax=Prosthecomicrobium sp. N25 TaxID=3129254 RepID=UPI0030768DEC